MIFQSINFISAQINQYFSSKLKLNEDLVVISNLVNLDGSIANNSEKKLILTMVNLMDDLIWRNNSIPDHCSNFNSNHLAVFSFHLLITANYSESDYGEGLSLITNIIEFIQVHSVFTKETSPNMPFGMEKLIIKMINYTPEQLNHLWTMHGGNYMPSIHCHILVS